METTEEFAEGQFSDAEEDSVEAHMPCPVLPMSDANAPQDDPEEDEVWENSDYIDKFEDPIYNSKGKTKNCFGNGSVASGNSVVNQKQKIQRFQPTEKLMLKFAGRINVVDKYDGVEEYAKAGNKVAEMQRKDADRLKLRDKSDRATTEQVLDLRTRIILYKMLNGNLFHEINGTIATGKEANVYHAARENGDHLAVKIYKTRIMSFRDRQIYMEGNHKFRRGYDRHNPAKMVQLWAEKETSNLHKLQKAGIRSPAPILLRNNVLVMSFIGMDGVPAPRLKDVDISESKARELYYDIVNMMWEMYWRCKFVHADLSEFNLLYSNGKAYVIDVSQALDYYNRKSLHFLRKDCTNITDFFRKKNVPTMTVKELCLFIINPEISEDNREEFLDRMMELSAERGEFSAEEKSADDVFKNAYLPQTLNEVKCFEEDLKDLKLGNCKTSDQAYNAILRFAKDPEDAVAKSKVPTKNEDQSDDESSQEEDLGEEKENEEGSDDDSNTKVDPKTRNGVGTTRVRGESPSSRKDRKKAVKEAQAEKRKTKVKKHVKKRSMKKK